MIYLEDIKGDKVFVRDDKKKVEVKIVFEFKKGSNEKERYYMISPELSTTRNVIRESEIIK